MIIGVYADELLCMRLNCVVQEESLARAKEEDEKRKEVTGRFQVSQGRVKVKFIRS